MPSVARLDVRIGFPLAWTPDEALAWVRERIAAAAAADPWLAEHPPEVIPNGFRAEGDVLVFEEPLANADSLRLELPASAFGGTEAVRFEIPKSVIVRR